MSSPFWNSRPNYRTGSSTNAEGRVSSNTMQIRELESRLEAMAMKCQVMWELLSHAGQLTDEHFWHKLQEIDLRDGQADGKMSGVAADCPQCQRKTSRRRATCLYCGASIGGGEVFSTSTTTRPRRGKRPDSQ